MTWECRYCGHLTVWWKGACDLCGAPLHGERRCYTGNGLCALFGASFAAAADFERTVAKVESLVKRVPVLDTGIGKSFGYADDKAFCEAAQNDRVKRLELLSPEGRVRVELAERELERRVIEGDGA